MQSLSASEQAMIEPIDLAAMVAQVERWCAINTGTHNIDGLAHQAAELADAFSVLPGDVELTHPALVEAIDGAGNRTEIAHGKHLILRVRPAAARRFLLTGHMDTVYPADHPFQRPIWHNDDTLNAPGAADMKGGLTLLLAALKAFETSETANLVGYDVLINSDEETGSLSSARLIDQLARGKTAALTYEPSALPDGTLAHTRGGSGNYTLVVRGRSAHAGRNPQDGRNAVVAAAALALGLKALETPDMPINPARIEGGSGNNVVPDLALLRFNIRPANSALVSTFSSNLKHLVDDVAAKHEVEISIHGGLSRPPKPVDAKAQRLFDLVQRCGAQLGQTIAWVPSGGVCDGNNIAAQGIPVVDTMGARGGAIHSPDEYLIVSSLAERAALSALVLHRLATEDPP